MRACIFSGAVAFSLGATISVDVAALAMKSTPWTPPFFQNLILLPEHHLAFCGIEKCGFTALQLVWTKKLFDGIKELLAGGDADGKKKGDKSE